MRQEYAFCTRTERIQAPNRMLQLKKNERETEKKDIKIKIHWPHWMLNFPIHFWRFQLVFAKYKNYTIYFNRLPKWNFCVSKKSWRSPSLSLSLSLWAFVFFIASLKVDFFINSFHCRFISFFGEIKFDAVLQWNWLNRTNYDRLFN